MNTAMIELGLRARNAARGGMALTSEDKNRGLLSVASELERQSEKIITANSKDILAARDRGLTAPLLDRLQLNSSRIREMADGLRQIAALDDPIGEVLSLKARPNGLKIGQKRVPLGVIGIIYESRPNVTADAFGLCFKTGNVTILRGGSDAFHSNMAIIQAIHEGLELEKIDPDMVLMVTDPSREAATAMMGMREYIDVLIPRGGAGLIQSVVEHAKIPVIETGTGNCHIYVDADADLEMAAAIIENAKTQRLGVCNACESLVIHQAVLPQVLPKIVDNLLSHGVELRGDEAVCALDRRIIQATEADWGAEYLAPIISIKTVADIQAAIAHINQYNSGHSEAIITDNYRNSMRFLDEIDAAAVYVNASTRFTDGFVFGFGAEIGISTQKLHARGPMGLTALTTTKYIILGDGQIRK